MVEELGLKSEGFATHEPLTKKLLLERSTTHWQVTDLQHNTSMLHSASSTWFYLIMGMAIGYKDSLALDKHI